MDALLRDPDQIETGFDLDFTFLHAGSQSPPDKISVDCISNQTAADNAHPEVIQSVFQCF